MADTPPWELSYAPQSSDADPPWQRRWTKQSPPAPSVDASRASSTLAAFGIKTPGSRGPAPWAPTHAHKPTIGEEFSEQLLDAPAAATFGISTNREMMGDMQERLGGAVRHLKHDVTAPIPEGGALKRVGGTALDLLDYLWSPVAASAQSTYGRGMSHLMGPVQEALGLQASTPEQHADAASFVVPFGQDALAAHLFNAPRAIAEARSVKSAADMARTARNAHRAPPPPIMENLNRFAKAGIDPLMAALSGNSSWSDLLAKMPWVGTPLRERAAASIRQTEDAGRRLAPQYGAVRGAGEAGELAQNAAERFATARGEASATGRTARDTTLKHRTDQLYDDAYRQIDEGLSARWRENNPSTPEYAYETAQDGNNFHVSGARQAEEPVPLHLARRVPFSNTTQTVQSILTRMTDPALSAMTTSKRMKDLGQALASGDGRLAFRDIRNLRTWIRDAQHEPNLREGVSEGELKQLYTALTADMKEAARSAGPSAERAMQRADTTYRAGQARVDRALEPLYGAKSEESALDRIWKMAHGNTVNAKALLGVKRSMRPEEWNDTVAALVHRMGRPEGVDALDPNAFDIEKFAKSYAEIATDAKHGKDARSILFGSSGGGGARASEIQAAMDNLVHVMKQQGHLKGIVGAGSQRPLGGGIMAAEIAGPFVAGLLGHNPAVMAAGAPAVLGSRVIADVLSDPAKVRAMAKSPQAAQEVLDAIRGSPLSEALSRTQVTPRSTLAVSGATAGERRDQ